MLTDEIDNDVMDGAGSGLRAAGSCALCVDIIGIAVAPRRGIPEGSTPGMLSDTTANSLLAWLLQP